MASSSKSVIPQDSLKFYPSKLLTSPKENLEALRDPSELNGARSLIGYVCNTVMNVISQCFKSFLSVLNIS